MVSKTIGSLKLHPSFDSEVADEVLYGMVVEVEEKAGEDWFLVKTHYDYKGYINKQDIILEDACARNWEKSAKYVITHSIVDVMAKPEYKSYLIVTLTKGAIVKATGVFEEKWEKIILADGKEGWIRKGFANEINKLSMEKNEEQLRNNIVKTALEYMNTQYRWGGKSPMGIDCSGLASIAYMCNGYIIPRDADIQQEYLNPVDREATKPGDLVFFPGHVALCIGDDRYVHATGREGYVLINSFNPEHQDYREDLVKSCTGAGTLLGMEV